MSEERRRQLRYGQAILLGVRIERASDQAYAKPLWYAHLAPAGYSVVVGPKRVRGMCGPWPTRWQAVNHALQELGVLQT